MIVVLIAFTIDTLFLKKIKEVLNKGSEEYEKHMTAMLEERRADGIDASRLIEYMKLEPGMTVGDLCCGSGLLTFPLAQAVGPTGRVYAVELQKKTLKFLESRISSQGGDFEKIITPVLNHPDDVNLKPVILDAAVLCEASFHCFREIHPDTVEMIDSIYRSVKPGGRLVILEQRDKIDGVPAKQSADVLAMHYERAGFIKKNVIDDYGKRLMLIELQKPLE